MYVSLHIAILMFEYTNIENKKYLNHMGHRYMWMAKEKQR